ncbi:MAG: class I SAM-dependent methyltransferase [Candidatus Heimdallarchaeaceae archaeon]
MEGKEYWRKHNDYGLLESHPHRQTLLEELKKLEFDSLLEIGCNYAPNLSLIKKEYPEVKLAGIDINRDSILRAILRVKDAELIVGDVNNLPFKDKSFDVILSDGVLIYVSPEEIDKVKSEMLRVARKALVLVEFHSEGLNEKGEASFDHWGRNYKELFKEYEVELTKITNWTERNWQTTGYFVTINLQKHEKEI